jgi:hypothetical protein
MNRWVKRGSHDGAPCGRRSVVTMTTSCTGPTTASSPPSRVDDAAQQQRRQPPQRHRVDRAMFRDALEPSPALVSSRISYAIHWTPPSIIGRHRRWPNRSSRSYRTCAAGESTSGFEHEDTASPRRSRLTGLWCCVVERGGRHRFPEVVQVGEYLPTLVLQQEEERRKLVDDCLLSVVQSDRSSSGETEWR